MMNGVKHAFELSAVHPSSFIVHHSLQFDYNPVMAEPDPHLNCPGCNEQVEVAPESAGHLVRCPYCTTDFFASQDQSHLPVVDDTSPEISEQDRQAAFDKLRIENFTALRMGAIRARSWWIIRMCLSLLAALDMIGKAAVYVNAFHQWGAEPILRATVAGVALMFAKHARKRAAAFKLEIEKSAIPEPAGPPDFSSLSDGSDRWKDLENVR